MGTTGTVLRALAVAAVATAAVVALGVVRSGPPEPGTAQPGPAPEPTSTTLAELDTATLPVRRSSFCSGVPTGAVEEAVGSEDPAAVSYDNGETAQLTPQLRDVAHEYGCAWSGDTGRAKAWVFAPPVTPARGRDLVRSAQAARGCEPLTDAPAYGDPSTAVLCRFSGQQQASFRGLFGDAWLTCSLQLPDDVAPAELLARTERWCVAVATAASTDAVAG